jgi:hypothetical protein
MVLGYPSKKSQYHRNPYAWKIVMTIFEFVGQFYFQNDVFKLQEDFSEHGIREFLENGLGNFQTFLQIWDKPDVPKTFQKQFWNLDSKPKKPRVLWFRKIPWVLFPQPLNKGIFSVSGIFIEDYLTNLNGWEKSKNRFGLSAPKLRSLISTHKNLFIICCVVKRRSD